MSWLGLVIVILLVSGCTECWSLKNPPKNIKQPTEKPVITHGEVKEDWEIKGKILYANEIIPVTTVSPNGIATTVDEISDDEGEENSTTFKLFCLNATEKAASEASTISEPDLLTTELTPIDNETGLKIPSKEARQGATLAKTRISCRPVGFLGRSNSSSRFKWKNGMFSKTKSKGLHNKTVASLPERDKSKLCVTTVRSVKREIRSLQSTDKAYHCKGLHSEAMKQLFSALMEDDFEPDKKKRENGCNPDRATSDFMSEGFWETPMTRIIGTGVDDVKVQFSRPLVNNFNSLNESDQFTAKDEPLQIIPNEDNGKNIRLFEDTNHLQSLNDKFGYYRSSMKKKDGDLDLEQYMNWPTRWEEQNKRVYGTKQSKKTLQKWGKLAGKLQPLWDAVDVNIEVTTEIRGDKEYSQIAYESKNLPVDDADKYKIQQNPNLGTSDSVRTSNEMEQSKVDTNDDRIQSDVQPSVWKEPIKQKNDNISREMTTSHFHRPSPENNQNTKGESTFVETGDILDRDRPSKYNSIAIAPPSNEKDYETDELMNPSPKVAQSKWEFADRNRMIEFPNPSAELQFLNVRNPIGYRKTQTMQDYRQGSHRKWGGGDRQKSLMKEIPSYWERTDVKKPDVLRSRVAMDEAQNKFIKEQQSQWEDVEIDDAQNKLMKDHQSKLKSAEIDNAYAKFMKEHQPKWENIEVEDVQNTFTNESSSNGQWESPNIVDPEARESSLKPEASERKGLKWKAGKNPSVKGHKKKWGSPTKDDRFFAEPNPSLRQTSIRQNPSPAEYSSKWPHSQYPSGEFVSKWPNPANYNPSAVFSNTNWNHIDEPGFVGRQSKWGNLQSLIGKDPDIVKVPSAMLDELSGRPTFEIPIPQMHPYKELQQNLRNPTGILVPNTKWDNVNYQTCSLTDDSLSMKSSNSNEQTPKDVKTDQTSMLTKVAMPWHNEQSKEASKPADNLHQNSENSNKGQTVWGQEKDICNTIQDPVSLYVPLSKGEVTVEQDNVQTSALKHQISVDKTQSTNSSSIWNQDFLNDWHSVKSQNDLRSGPDNIRLVGTTRNLDGEGLSRFTPNNRWGTINPQRPPAYESCLSPKLINTITPEQVGDRSSNELQTFPDPSAKGISTDVMLPESPTFLAGNPQPIKDLTIVQNESVDEANPLQTAKNCDSLQGKQVNIISSNELPLPNDSLMKSDVFSSKSIELCHQTSDYGTLNGDNPQFIDPQNKWKYENMENPSLRDIQRQWDTANYVSNPITAESQLHWEQGSLEGELEPHVPDLPTLVQESQAPGLNNNKSQNVAKETQNLSSTSVKPSKLHARTTSVKNIKMPTVKEEGLPAVNLNTSKIKDKSEINKSVESDLTFNSTLKNSPVKDNVNLDKECLKYSSNMKSESLKEKLITNKENYTLDNSLDDIKVNNPDLVNFVENPNECEQKEKLTKSIRSSERQSQGKSKNKKSQSNTGINVDVDDIIVCDSPLTYGKDSEDEQYYNIQSNKEKKQRRNRIKVIESKARSFYDLPPKKTWKISKNIRNKIVSKAKKRKMVPPINITIAMKNLFNRVSPSEVFVRNSSTLDPDGSFKFSIELKDKMAKFYKRSIVNLLTKNETSVTDSHNK